MTQPIPRGATDRACVLFSDLVEGRWEKVDGEFDRAGKVAGLALEFRFPVRVSRSNVGASGSKEYGEAGS